MEIIKLECPNCGGNLKVDETAETATCIHCGFDFLVEQQKPDVHHHYYSNTVSNTPWEGFAKQPADRTAKLVMGRIVVVFAAIMLTFLFISIVIYFTGVPKTSAVDIVSGEVRTVLESSIIIDFAEFVFAKPLAQITDSDYKTIKYLQLESTSVDQNNWDIYYSFKDYYSTSDFEKTIKHVTLKYTSDDEIDKKDLQVFSGLTALHLPANSILSYDPVSLKHLTKLTAYSGSFNESFSATSEKTLPKAEQIKELKVQVRSQKDLEELLRFSYIESLTITYFGDEVENLQQLSTLKKLTHLGIENSGDISWISSLTQLKSFSLQGYSIADYSVLHGLPYLEVLEITSGHDLKTVDFIASMPKLKDLELTNTSIITLAPLEGNKSLQSLRLSSNSDLSDISALSSLSSLQNLELDSRPRAPDLSALKQLTHVLVYDSSFASIANLSSITNLTLKYANDFSPSQLANFNKLEILVLEESKLNNVHQFNLLPSLTTITIRESSTDTTVDSIGLFQLDHVKSLSISDSTLYLSDNQEVIHKNNTALTELYFTSRLIHLDKDFTTVPFDEFAKQYISMANVQTLYLPNQKITTLDFISGTPKLVELNVRNNYITDISPLTNLKELESLVISGNIVANIDLLDSKVGVLK